MDPHATRRRSAIPARTRRCPAGRATPDHAGAPSPPYTITIGSVQATEGFLIFTRDGKNGYTLVRSDIGGNNKEQVTFVTSGTATTSYVTAQGGGSKNVPINTVSVSPVPEPTTMAMALVAPPALGVVRRLRRRGARA